MQIKNRYTDAVIFEDDKPTLRETVLNAVAQKANLARANLARANLARADLAGADLAKRAGLAFSSIQALESGRTTSPTLGTLRSLAEALGVKVGDLTG